MQANGFASTLQIAARAALSLSRKGKIRLSAGEDGMSKYGHRSLNWFEAIVNKLGGEESAEAFLRGEIVAVGRVFETWKTVTIGSLKSAEKARNLFKSDTATEFALDILKNVSFSDKEKKLNLVMVSVAELGFKEGTIHEKLYIRAQDLGLQLCPAEVGPALRLAIDNRSIPCNFFIAMQPILGSIFTLKDDFFDPNVPWLDTHNGEASHYSDSLDQWVFVRP